MKKEYNKPPLSFEKQLNLLIERGLVVSNKTFALKILSSISYYRLSAYWYPFRKRNSLREIEDIFVANTSFETCFNLYEFDRKLRLIMLDAIERIEVAVRTQITYVLGHLYGAFAHCNPKNFHEKFPYKEWRIDIEKEVQRSNAEFVTHYQENYSGFPILPLWMLTELISLGCLSKLYTGMKNQDKKIVANQFQVHYKTFTHWLHVLTYIRNVCAHHSRLWNREFSIRSEKLKDKSWSAPLTPRNDRIFYILLILRCLLKITNNGNEWFEQVNTILEPFANIPKYRAAMGMPEKWREHPIWLQQNIFSVKNVTSHLNEVIQ